MEQNQPEFPQLRCAEHKSPIILVSPDFKTDQKNFFCAKCIALGQSKDNSNLVVYEEFVSNIATSSGINVAPSQEATLLAQAKAQKIEVFESHLESEKNHISLLSTELQNQYQEKCNEMVKELKSVLEGQKSVFRNFYNRFEEEIQIDNEQEANIPKFSEIRENVIQLEDMEKIEPYLAQIVHQKESWKAASVEVRTLGKRTEDFYREQIEKLSEQQPTFTSKEQILEIWTKGLNDLIERVKNQSGCFNNLFEQTQGIHLTISSSQEVTLLTNSMIKEDTELVLNFAQKPLNLAEAQRLGAHLATLTNLRHLTVIFDNNHATSENVEEISKALNSLTGLKNLHINYYGNKLGDSFTVSLGESVGKLVSLENLSFEVGMNDLTSTSVSNLVSGFSALTHLKSFTFDAKYNRISDVSALATAVSTFASTLTHLTLNFGGYAISKNTLTSDSSKQLVRSIRQFTNLTNLSIDLGYTGIDDASAIELSQSLKDLVLLRSVNIQLYQNHIETRAAAKIVKRLSKIQKLTTVDINLNFNDKIRLDGAREIVSSFRQMVQLNKLNLSLIKVGVDKENQINFKTDLNKNKLGSPFESLIVLF